MDKNPVWLSHVLDVALLLLAASPVAFALRHRSRKIG